MKLHMAPSYGNFGGPLVIHEQAFSMLECGA
jgi:hypothetical protein